MPDAATLEPRVVLAARDVTERKVLERQRDEFIAMLAHDLRNPVSNLAQALDVLQSLEPVVASAGHVFDPMKRSSDRLIGLIANYLDALRLEAGRMPIEQRPIDLNHVLDSLAAQHAGQASAAQVRLALALDPALGTAVVDPIALERVFANLLGNALKFTPPGGRIEIATEGQADAVVVRITDDGPGIPEALLPTLFDRYSQAAEGRRARGGVGLGLFVAKSIAGAHGGSIDVASRSGAGSTFAVRLPRGGAVRTVPPPLADPDRPSPAP